MSPNGLLRARGIIVLVKSTSWSKISRQNNLSYSKNAIQPPMFWLSKPALFATTVNARYSGHPRDRDLVSVKARVRNSGVRENFYFKPYLQKGVTCVFIFINSSTFFRPVVASKERQNFIYKQNRT